MAKGRPRTFDLDSALDRAMRVFWRKGYEGTTMPDLTAAMGINRPSLYAAFGNKEALFTKVLGRYRANPASYLDRALEKATAREVFESLLDGVVDLLTDPENPGGCLLVQAALSCSDECESIRNELAGHRLTGEREIQERFVRAIVENDLPTGCDPANLAKYTTTIMWGLAVQSASGCTREEMLSVARLAVDAWAE